MDQHFETLVSALSAGGLPGHLDPLRKKLLNAASFEARRLATKDPYLIIGLLGPNNAGKSTLFAKLTACDVSPPAADGGYTRHLTAAAHPETLKRLVKENRLGEFSVSVARAPLTDEERRKTPSNRLFLAPSSKTPRHLVVIDAPDFDSIDDANHKVSEGLSRIADLIVCVVTKHTYSNATVRRIMGSAVEGRRPYFLVYNEAIDRETARRHLQALVDDFAGNPRGCFYARLDIEVQSDPGALEVLSVADDRPLNLTFLPAEDVGHLLLEARAARLRKLARYLERLAREWNERVAGLKRFKTQLEDRAQAFGQDVAATSYPIEPMVDAVIAELDERGAWHKHVRTSNRAVANGVLWAAKGLRRGVLKAGKWAAREGSDWADQRWGTHLRDYVPAERFEQPTAPQETKIDAPLIELEQQALHHRWKGFASEVESIASEALKPLESAQEQFRKEFHPDRMDAIQSAIIAVTREGFIPDDYRSFCRREVGEALDRRGDNQDLQWWATSLAAAPAAAGIAVSLATGGIGGEDIAIGGAAALTTPLFEKLVRLVGQETAQRVRSEWIQRRGTRIANATVHACAPEALDIWSYELATAGRQLAQIERGAGELRELLQEIGHER